MWDKINRTWVAKIMVVRACVCVRACQKRGGIQRGLVALGHWVAICCCWSFLWLLFPTHETLAFRWSALERRLDNFYVGQEKIRHSPL
jgi:hypothetical protein